MFEGTPAELSTPSLDTKMPSWMEMVHMLTKTNMPAPRYSEKGTQTQTQTDTPGRRRTCLHRDTVRKAHRHRHTETHRDEDEHASTVIQGERHRDGETRACLHYCARCAV